MAAHDRRGAVGLAALAKVEEGERVAHERLVGERRYKGGDREARVALQLLEVDVGAVAGRSAVGRRGGLEGACAHEGVERRRHHKIV